MRLTDDYIPLLIAIASLTTLFVLTPLVIQLVWWLLGGDVCL
jgi:hypothetical protein